MIFKLLMTCIVVAFSSGWVGKALPKKREYEWASGWLYFIAGLSMMAMPVLCIIGIWWGWG